jgi:Fe-S cluster biogenesis protein NfuA
MADPGRPAELDDAAVEQRLARLDELLSQLEQIPGATAALGLEAVQGLTEVYGTALARILAAAADAPGLLAAFDSDELLRNLMILHGLHPLSTTERVNRALEQVRPYLHSHGGDVTLLSVADGVARIAFTGYCDGCTSSTSTLEAVIRDAVLAVAPELYRVDAEPAAAPAHPAPVIPIDALLRRPAGAR